MGDIQSFPPFYDSDRASRQHTISISEYLALPVDRRATLSQYWCRYIRKFDGTDRSAQILGEIIEVCRVVFTGDYYKTQRAVVIEQLRRLLEILRGTTAEEYYMYQDLVAYQALKDATAEFITLSFES